MILRKEREAMFFLDLFVPIQAWDRFQRGTRTDAPGHSEVKRKYFFFPQTNHLPNLGDHKTALRYSSLSAWMYWCKFCEHGLVHGRRKQRYKTCPLVSYKEVSLRKCKVDHLSKCLICWLPWSSTGAETTPRQKGHNWNRYTTSLFCYCISNCWNWLTVTWQLINNLSIFLKKNNIKSYVPCYKF